MEKVLGLKKLIAEKVFNLMKFSAAPNKLFRNTSLFSVCIRLCVLLVARCFYQTSDWGPCLKEKSLCSASTIYKKLQLHKIKTFVSIDNGFCTALVTDI